MNMNMKNEKTMLALVLVAALAMVSVAGVALASESDAASVVLINNDQIIDSKVDTDLNVYVPFTAGGDIIGGEFVMTITSDANYTGTIQFGTWNAQTNAYLPAITLNLAGVSSAKITFTAEDNKAVSHVALIETIADTNKVASTTGTITVSNGALELGDSNYFSGTVVASDAKLVSENTKGAILTANGKILSAISEAGIIGSVTAGSQKYLVTYYNNQDDTVAKTMYKTVPAKLTVYGTATVGDLSIDGIEVVIDKDANVSLNADAAKYFIKGGDSFKVQVAATNDSNLSNYHVSAAIYDSLGQIVAFSKSTATGGYATFDVKSGQILDITGSQSYTMYMTIIDGTTATAPVLYYYFGSVTFNTVEATGYVEPPSGDRVETELAYTTLTVNWNTTSVSVATLSGTSEVGDKDIAGKMTIGEKVLNYNNNKYALVFAFEINSAGDEYSNGYDAADVSLGEAFEGALTSTGKITFTNAAAASDKMVIILKDKTSDSFVLFQGTLDANGNLKVATTSFVNPIEPVTTMTGVSTLGKILSGSAVASSTNGSTKSGSEGIVYKDKTGTETLFTPGIATKNLTGFDGIVNTLTITNTTNSKLTINGTFGIYYSSDKFKGDISNLGTIDVNNTLTYQVKKSSSVNTTLIGGTINAAMYKTSAATGQAYDTYTYTTLDNAMTAAANLYVCGTITILKDMELTGTPVGTETSKNVITVLGKIVIGQKAKDAVKETANAPSEPAKEAIEVIVTVPSTTKLVLSGSADVQNGQLKIAGLKSDSYNVRADVFISDSTYGTYTDLTTSFGITKSGDVINIRSTVTSAMELSKSATLASGVTLNGLNKDIIVPAGVTFTVDGILKINDITVKSATTTKTAGTLVLNTYDKNSTIATITLSGIVTVGANFDNSADSSSAVSTGLIIKGTSTAYPAAFNVLGKLKYSGTITATNAAGVAVATTDGATINGVISGELKFSGSFDPSLANVKFIGVISGTLTTSTVFWISEATVTGKVAVTGTGAFKVKNLLIVGTPATKLNANSNTAEVTAQLQSGVYAFVYGTPADSTKIVIQDANGAQITDKTTYYLNTDVVFATGYANGEKSVTKIADPEISGMLFYGWYKNAVLTTAVVSGDYIGVVEKVYGKLEVKTVKVTFNPLLNGHWVINGDTYVSGSDIALKESGNVITFVADKDYKIEGTVIIYVGTTVMPASYTPQAGDVLSVTAEIVKDEKAAGMDLVTILLIIITIVIIIMAIIIALKLMRS